MSWINGHWYITQEAIRTLSEDCASNPLVRSLERETPQANSVLRDLMDILNRNHWQNDGQRNHFMRRFQGQTVRVAYLENVSYVQERMRRAAQAISRQLHRYPVPNRPPPPGPATCPAPSFRSRSMEDSLADGGRPLEGSGLQPLGDSLHAVQDSFSESHVRRATYDQPHRPGDIQHILRYRGAEREHHEERDSEWRLPGGAFSLAGRAAIMASRDLIALTLIEAVRIAYPHRVTGRAMHFGDFQRQWLKASSELLYSTGANADMNQAEIR